MSNTIIFLIVYLVGVLICLDGGMVDTPDLKFSNQ